LEVVELLVQQAQRLLKEQLQLFQQLMLQVVVEVDMEQVLIVVQELEEEMVDLAEAVLLILVLLVEVQQEVVIHLQQVQHKAVMEEQDKVLVQQPKLKMAEVVVEQLL
jgi:hypothetical protein